MKICCVGDSLTFGNVGYSYIHFLDKSIEVKNKGVNGDTLKGLYKRFKKILNNPNSNYDIYVVSIGSNDILLPYLKTVSPFWFLQMSIRCKIKKCIEEDNIFCVEYEKLLKLLSKKNKNVIILGMPILNLMNFPHKKLLNRNLIINELAEKYNYPFIDINKLQATHIEKESYEYSWKYSFPLRVFDAIVMTIFPFTKDWLSKTRGLTMTVDGAHFNSKSAELVAKEVEKTIMELFPGKYIWNECNRIR